MQDYTIVCQSSVARVDGGCGDGQTALLIYQQSHYQRCLAKRKPLIQNDGATSAVKAGFKLHFPRLPWRLWEVIMKRGFSEQRRRPSGYCHSGFYAAIARERQDDDQKMISLFTFFSVVRRQRSSTIVQILKCLNCLSCFLFFRIKCG